MDEAEISAILDRVAPKRSRDTDRGVLRAALHAYLKAGVPEAEAIELARKHADPECQEPTGSN